VRVDCLHGYFIFNEDKVGELSRFLSIYDFEIERKDDYFTFSSLIDAPKYSIEGANYLGAPCIKTFEGHPWEIMRANKLVYDFAKDLVVPIATITTRPSIFQAANYFFSSGLIMPGSVKDDGTRVTEYASRYLFDSVKFKYSDVIYE
jgi:hypothetical protein